MTRKTLTDDWASATKGLFRLENNVWNKGDLVNGEDFRQTISYNPANLSTSLKFAWNWPEADHILAYPEIVAGYKPWSGAGSNALTARVSTIEALTIDLDYDIAGQTDLFNAAIDMWLTKRAHGPASSITTEVKIWTHAGEISDPSGRKIGIYRDGDFRAEIWVANDSGANQPMRYITLVSNREIRDETLDIGRLLHKLADRHLVNEDSFFNGYEFGAELAGGKGSLTVHHLDHDLETTQTAATDLMGHGQVADDFHF